MPEYIKRMSAMTICERYSQHCFETNDNRGQDIADRIFDEITEIPTVDVAEVVRCENCKHLTIHNSPTLYAYCEKMHYRFEPFEIDTRTHFCGFGELKEREGK